MPFLSHFLRDEHQKAKFCRGVVCASSWISLEGYSVFLLLPVFLSGMQIWCLEYRQLKGSMKCKPPASNIGVTKNWKEFVFLTLLAASSFLKPKMKAGGTSPVLFSLEWFSRGGFSQALTAKRMQTPRASLLPWLGCALTKRRWSLWNLLRSRQLSDDVRSLHNRNTPLSRWEVKPKRFSEAVFQNCSKWPTPLSVQHMSCASFPKAQIINRDKRKLPLSQGHVLKRTLNVSSQALVFQCRICPSGHYTILARMYRKSISEKFKVVKYSRTWKYCASTSLSQAYQTCFLVTTILFNGFWSSGNVLTFCLKVVIFV